MLFLEDPDLSGDLGERQPELGASAGLGGEGPREPLDRCRFADEPGHGRRESKGADHELHRGVRSGGILQMGDRLPDRDAERLHLLAVHRARTIQSPEEMQRPPGDGAPEAVVPPATGDYCVRHRLLLPTPGSGSYRPGRRTMQHCETARRARYAAPGTGSGHGRHPGRVGEGQRRCWHRDTGRARRRWPSGRRQREDRSRRTGLGVFRLRRQPALRPQVVSPAFGQSGPIAGHSAAGRPRNAERPVPLAALARSGRRSSGRLRLPDAVRPDNYLGLVHLLTGLASTPSPSACRSRRPWRLCGQLAQSFLRLHALGLCYRDVSFGNVFLPPRTATSSSATTTTSASTAARRRSSEPASSSPRDRAPRALPTARTDLHSLAVLLFYADADHPLEGAKTDAGLVDNDWVTEHFGNDPLFIFHPLDERNRPTSSVPLLYWSHAYPQFLRALFVQAFTAGLDDPDAGSVSRCGSRRCRRLRDCMTSCQARARPCSGTPSSRGRCARAALRTSRGRCC